MNSAKGAKKSWKLTHQAQGSGLSEEEPSQNAKVCLGNIWDPGILQHLTRISVSMPVTFPCGLSPFDTMNTPCPTNASPSLLL